MMRPKYLHIIKPIIGFVILLFLCPASSYAYLKIDSPPDVDKTSLNATCWLATAANMLAAAGYGISNPGSDPATPENRQARAEYIYDELVAHFGAVT